MITHKSDLINTKGHHLQGIRWPVLGSKGDKYEVEILDSGFSCNCIAYRKCKHIKTIENTLANPLGETDEVV